MSSSFLAGIAGMVQRAAGGCPHVLGANGDVGAWINGGWQKVKPGMLLPPKGRICTGDDSGATVVFPGRGTR
jgi:hypothetical protein